MTKKSITPEAMAERLRQVLGDRLGSVILYGSAAAGDFLAERSDYNLLVVARQLGAEELSALSRPTRAWVKEGNPPPLMFTLERLKSSADVFPIELLDIKERHRVLFGDDCVADLEVSAVNLRHQLEYELKSKLLQLRERALLVGDNKKQTLALMVDSISTFLVLFRGALRLFQRNVQATKIEAARLLSRELDFSLDVFETVHAIRSGAQSSKDLDAGMLFQRYLESIEAVVDKVDRHARENES